MKLLVPAIRLEIIHASDCKCYRYFVNVVRVNVVGYFTVPSAVFQLRTVIIGTER